MSTSPSFMAAGPVMFSTKPASPITLTGSFKARWPAWRRASWRAGHVALHGQHAVGRFERQAARVERHAFADDRQGRVGFRRASIAQDHQPRRPARSFGHGQQRAAALLLRAAGWSQTSIAAHTRRRLGRLRRRTTRDTFRCGGSLTSRRGEFTLSPRIRPPSIAAGTLLPAQKKSVANG